MLSLRIESCINGYVVYISHDSYRERYVAIDIQALGLLVKQLAGAEKHRQCKAKRKTK